jgi:hypothetical protein
MAYVIFKLFGLRKGKGLTCFRWTEGGSDENHSVDLNKGKAVK